MEVGGIIFRFNRSAFFHSWPFDGVPKASRRHRHTVPGQCAIVRYRCKYQAFPASGSFE